MTLKPWFLPVFALAATTAGGGAVAADPQVDMKTNFGTVRLELYPDKAPETVANFLKYVQDGHYDGTIFHRVIVNFMIQGGGFERNYQQKKTRDPIRNEAERAVKGGLKNEIGTIAQSAYGLRRALLARCAARHGRHREDDGGAGKEVMWRAGSSSPTCTWRPSGRPPTSNSSGS
jgi:hypothetical protein